MARCTRKNGLDVYLKRCNGGNDLSNAEVLCNLCHEATATYGTPGNSPSTFSEDTKAKALRCSGNQCECVRVGGCH